MGFKLRGSERVECGLRLGWFPTLWTAEVHANFFAANPNPLTRGTWYGGPEFIYYNEDGASGKFQQGFLSGVFGREKRITPRLRWAWEAGLGVMIFHAYQGGGVPILFPVLPLGRAELRYAVL